MVTTAELGLPALTVKGLTGAWRLHSCQEDEGELLSSPPQLFSL